MQTTKYTIVIVDDCSNSNQARFIELNGLTDLEAAKNQLWQIITSIAALKGFDVSNEGDYYIAAGESVSCYVGKIINEATGEVILLD